MTPYYADESVTLHHGDCLDVMRTLPDNSVDAVVTDPPYGLGFMGKAWDAKFISSTIDQRRQYPGDPSEKSGENGGYRSAAAEAGRYDQTASGNRAFGAWCEEWMAECLRVLKPGGHLLSFGGSRTWHRLATAAEDAGFEMRDSIAWLYGSGFPKSLDVSKAIDKRAEVNGETSRRIAAVAEVIRTHREAKGLTRSEVSLAVVGTASGACWNWEHQQLPSTDMWPAIKATLGIPDTFDGLIEGDRARFIAAEREVLKARTMRQGGGTSLQIRMGELREVNADVTAPATPDAERWQGWGTALKPAFEPVVVARKPLSGTVAANVLAHGTGALNVDGCRTGTPEDKRAAGSKTYTPRGMAGGEPTRRELQAAPHDGLGRWPTNVLLDGSQADALDEQSGTLTSGANPTRRGADKFRDAYGEFAGQEECIPARGADSGGASRFFPTFRYEAKAPTAERPRHGEVSHPTVKPLDLMRWLVRLVTPPGGVVLEPFAGSGTTAEACVIEGFRCIAIEREAAYLPLIVARLSKPIQVDLFGGAA